VTSRLGWAHLGEFHEKRSNITRAISLGQDPLEASGLGEFGRALVSASPFQLSFLALYILLFLNHPHSSLES